YSLSRRRASGRGAMSWVTSRMPSAATAVRLLHLPCFHYDPRPRERLPQIYLDANLRIKEEVLFKTTPITTTAGRYQPDDDLLAFLKGL
ncbi:MAG TPA: hypothetical protein VIY49_06225, partial [Bryobacteraceae bacterium]